MFHSSATEVTGAQLGTMSSFTAADYVVCGMMLSISAMIGVYFACSGGRQRSQAVSGDMG